MFNPFKKHTEVPEANKEEIIKQIKAYLELESMKGGKPMSRNIKDEVEDDFDSVEEEDEEEVQQLPRLSPSLQKKMVERKPEPRPEPKAETSQPSITFSDLNTDTKLSVIYAELIQLKSMLKG